jgi:hypothetical protein
MLSRLVPGIVLIGLVVHAWGGHQLLGSTRLPAALQAGNGSGQGDWSTDVSRIMGALEELGRIGVEFDDHDPEGYVPLLRADGRYHMACIDLVHVAYRAAGYDLMAFLRSRHAPTRSVLALAQAMETSREYRYFPCPPVNPLETAWRPREPFRVGDILFLHYANSAEQHSGIVSSVDPSGRPLRIAHVSPYNEEADFSESSLAELFQVSTRRLTGHARPAAWDRPNRYEAADVTDLDTVHPVPQLE